MTFSRFRRTGSAFYISHEFHSLTSERKSTKTIKFGVERCCWKAISCWPGRAPVLWLRLHEPGFCEELLTNCLRKKEENKSLPRSQRSRLIAMRVTVKFSLIIIICFVEISYGSHVSVKNIREDSDGFSQLSRASIHPLSRTWQSQRYLRDDKARLLDDSCDSV